MRSGAARTPPSPPPRAPHTPEDLLHTARWHRDCCYVSHLRSQGGDGRQALLHQQLAQLLGVLDANLRHWQGGHTRACAAAEGRALVGLRRREDPPFERPGRAALALTCVQVFSICLALAAVMPVFLSSCVSCTCRVQELLRGGSSLLRAWIRAWRALWCR